MPNHPFLVLLIAGGGRRCKEYKRALAFLSPDWALFYFSPACIYMCRSKTSPARLSPAAVPLWPYFVDSEGNALIFAVVFFVCFVCCCVRKTTVEGTPPVVRPGLHGGRRVPGVLQVRFPVLEGGHPPHHRERRRRAAPASGEPVLPARGVQWVRLL